MKHFLLIATLIWMALTPQSHAVTSPRYFFNIPPIEGESLYAKHPKEIIAMAFQFQAGNNGTYFVLLKSVDIASTDLVQAMLSGTSFATAKFTCEAPAANPKTYFTIEFSNLVVTNTNIADEGLGDPTPVERVTFSFGVAKITTYTYNQKNAASTKSVSVLVNSP